MEWLSGRVYVCPLAKKAFFRPGTVARMLDTTLTAAVHSIDANIIQVEPTARALKPNRTTSTGWARPAQRSARVRPGFAQRLETAAAHITINLARRHQERGFRLRSAHGLSNCRSLWRPNQIKRFPASSLVSCRSTEEFAGVPRAFRLLSEAHGHKILRMVVPETNAREAAMVGRSRGRSAEVAAGMCLTSSTPATASGPGRKTPIRSSVNGKGFSSILKTFANPQTT